MQIKYIQISYMNREDIRKRRKKSQGTDPRRGTDAKGSVQDTSL